MVELSLLSFFFLSAEDLFEVFFEREIVLDIQFLELLKEVKHLQVEMQGRVLRFCHPELHFSLEVSQDFELVRNAFLEIALDARLGD